MYPCVYYNAVKNTSKSILLDDLIIFTDQKHSVNLLIDILKEHLEIKDIGLANQCVVLRITRGDEVMLDK